MKKKIGDLTLNEIKEYCYNRNYCAKDDEFCPLYDLMYSTCKKILHSKAKELNQEIEVEDNERKRR